MDTVMSIRKPCEDIRSNKTTVESSFDQERIKQETLMLLTSNQINNTAITCLDSKPEFVNNFCQSSKKL